MARIVVTGGTGTLGKVLVSQLKAHGHIAQVLTSRTTSEYGNEVSGNLVTGENLRKALSGAEVIIHCASNPLDHQHVDVQGTTNLMANLDRFSVQQIIYVSILGIDKSAYPYYRSKKAAEEHIQASGIPCCILRFSQFHDFVLSFIPRFVYDSSETIEIPKDLSFQSIDLMDVSEEIIKKLYLPASIKQDYAGPEVLAFADMVQALCRYRYKSYTVKTADLHNDLFTAFSKGANLSPNKIVSGFTWEQFLARKYAV